MAVDILQFIEISVIRRINLDDPTMRWRVGSAASGDGSGGNLSTFLFCPDLTREVYISLDGWYFVPPTLAGGNMTIGAGAVTDGLLPGTNFYTKITSVADAYAQNNVTPFFIGKVQGSSLNYHFLKVVTANAAATQYLHMWGRIWEFLPGRI